MLAHRGYPHMPGGRTRTRSQGRGCARPASEGAADVSTSKAHWGLIPASPDTDTSPVSGRDGGPASSWTRSQGRGCARPASEGSLDESPSRPDGLRARRYHPPRRSRAPSPPNQRAPEGAEHHAEPDCFGDGSTSAPPCLSTDWPASASSSGNILP